MELKDLSKDANNAHVHRGRVVGIRGYSIQSTPVAFQGQDDLSSAPKCFWILGFKQAVSLKDTE